MGQIGLTDVTFFTVLPLTHVIVNLLAIGFAKVVDVGEGVDGSVGVATVDGVVVKVGTFSIGVPISFTCTVGDEKVNDHAFVLQVQFGQIGAGYFLPPFEIVQRVLLRLRLYGEDGERGEEQQEEFHK